MCQVNATTAQLLRAEWGMESVDVWEVGMCAVVTGGVTVSGDCVCTVCIQVCVTVHTRLECDSWFENDLGWFEFVCLLVSVEVEVELASTFHDRMSDQSSNPVSTHTHTLDVWNESSNSSNQTSPSPPSHLHDHHHEHHQDSPTPSNSQQQLPSNPSSSSPQTNFPPWLIIALWISISSAVIFYNALILVSWFPTF